MRGSPPSRSTPRRRRTSPFGQALLEPPWRAATRVQPPHTRLIDLAQDEEALRGAMKRKHRQYVAKADREGITIERMDGSAFRPIADQWLDDFYAIYTHTAERAGFVARVARLLPARMGPVRGLPATSACSFATRDGERLATLFHFTVGDRAAEAFGGMTDAGADSRANYLLKWEAIAGFKRDGFATYDLWGLATGGIAQFKEGFGGPTGRLRRRPRPAHQAGGGHGAALRASCVRDRPARPAAPVGQAPCWFRRLTDTADDSRTCRRSLTR